MIELIYLVFIILVSFALGQKILRLIKVKFSSELENFAFSFPLGMAVLAYITFFIGIIGFLYKSVILSIFLIIFVFLIKDIIIFVNSIIDYIQGLYKQIAGKKLKIKFGFWLLVWSFLFLFIALNFIVSFTPPWHFDVLAYHLAVPKIYINAHQIIYIPYIFFSNLPSLVDTINLIGLLSYNGVLSNLLAYTLGVALVIAIYSFCLRFFNKKIAILSSLIFYTFPMIIRIAPTSHVDIQFALFVFLSFYGLFLYFQSGILKYLILSAIFAGFGASSKIFGGVAAIGILIILLGRIIKKSLKSEISLKKSLFALFFFCLISFIVFSPWLLKNYYFTGNPVWPAANSFFNGRNWDARHQEGLSSIVNVRKMTLTNYLRLPWDIHTQSGASIGNIDNDEAIGPYFLAFLPIYFFLKKRNELINTFFILLIIYLTIWFFMSYYFRYTIYSWPLIAIISAYVISELMENPILSRILAVLLLFTFGFCFLIWIGGYSKQIPVAIGIESEGSFYTKHPGPIYSASKFINSNLPAGSKILLFRDTRGFFIDSKYVWADPLLQLEINYSKFRNNRDYYKELKYLNVTHILVNTEFEFRGQIVNDYRYTEGILNMSAQMLENHGKRIYNKWPISVYEID